MLQFHSTFRYSTDSFCGRFLLAQLHLDSLAKKQNRRDVRIALKNLPKKLDDTYDDAMQRIWSQDDDDVKLAQNVLCWISCAFRPLSITEIQHALAVQSGDRGLDGEALPDDDLLISVCAGLSSGRDVSEKLNRGLAA